KPAIGVWASVRLEPDCAPSALTSLNSAAYSGLASAGGPSDRNWPGLFIVSGVTVANWPKTLFDTGPTGRHSPGWSPTGHGSTSNRPSVLRAAIIAAAAAAPIVRPSSLA